MGSIMLEYLTDERLDFKQHFRISRQSFRILLGILWSDMPPRTHGWTREVELLTFLFWLGCGSAFRIVGCVFNIPRTTTFRMVHRALKAIVAKLHLMVFPTQVEKLDAVQQGFARLSRNKNFLGFVGAIDGCHVRVLAPVALHDDYINRKRFYSVQLQAVCDHEGVFLDIFVGYPGSVHDSRVLRNSPLDQQSLYPPPGFAILGDSGYPCISSPIMLITPFKDPRTPVESRFNTLHSKARSVVERAFGLMKGRWRSVFTKALEVSVKKAPLVIAACAAMHNVCIRAEDFCAEELQEGSEEPEGMLAGNIEGEGDATRFRSELAARLSCPTSSSSVDHDYHHVLTHTF
ncbi:putative nuclease HARBI1 [Ornithodoros turicata]|uniref:putative nuclease HARBI1 n=1 Tax=Ornithodoros turicata TaxID=34597 RepID=UPI00313A45F9